MDPERDSVRRLAEAAVSARQKAEREQAVAAEEARLRNEREQERLRRQRETALDAAWTQAREAFGALDREARGFVREALARRSKFEGLVKTHERAMALRTELETLGAERQTLPQPPGGIQIRAGRGTFRGRAHADRSGRG